MQGNRKSRPMGREKRRKEADQDRERQGDRAEIKRKEDEAREI